MTNIESKPTRASKAKPDSVLVHIGLEERQVDALIKRGYLRQEDRDNVEVLAKALRAFLSDDFGGHHRAVRQH